MKRTKVSMVALLLAFTLVVIAACGGANNDDETQNGNENNGNHSHAHDDGGHLLADDFFHSDGLDENGFWAGITALNYVDIFNYAGIRIPREVHYISDDALQAEIDSIMAFFPGGTQVFDRAVQLGDTVNIDFVGSIDGVEFDGGSTGGMGTEVIIGVTSFIDDFLYQLIDGMPGDVINVEVTFPDEYHEPSLQGEGALFVTTINFIVEPSEPELTDDFVVENLAMFYGWMTVEDMIEGMIDQMQTESIREFIQGYVMDWAVVTSIPEAILIYQENSMISNYRMHAADSGMDFEDFISAFMGTSDIDELIAMHMEDIINEANFTLIIQAIAEDAGLRVSQEDLENYFLGFVGSGDYSGFEEMYGLPFLKKVVLSQVVFEYMLENAILE